MNKDELKYKLKLAKEAMSLLAQERDELEQYLKFTIKVFEERAAIVQQLEEQLAKMED